MLEGLKELRVIELEDIKGSWTWRFKWMVSGSRS